MDIGLIHRFEKGYEEGARSVNPNIRVIQNYVGVTDGAWNNPGKGKELALAQIGKGADVIFTAAGNSGLGAFDAVEQAGTVNGRATHFVIGVDSNQNMVKPGFVLTSMIKRVDNAVYAIVDDVVAWPVPGRLPCVWSGQGRRRLRDGPVQQRPADAGDDSSRRRGEDRRSSPARSRFRTRWRSDGASQSAVGLSPLPVMLELRNITKRFGNVLANDQVNILVGPGTIHAIVGENGAGKSTAMRDRLRLLHGRTAARS